MKRPLLNSSFIVLIVMALIRSSSAQTIERYVVAGGGNTGAGGGLMLSSTVGQPLIGLVADSSHFHGLGFWYLSADFIVTRVEDSRHELPTTFRLEQNYPNPFNPQTTIRFAVPKPSEVRLKLFDLMGREVAVLVDERLQPGEYKVVFNGRRLGTGIYFYKLETRDFAQTRKLTILK
jgi:hypothetical protein